MISFRKSLFRSSPLTTSLPHKFIQIKPVGPIPNILLQHQRNHLLQVIIISVSKSTYIGLYLRPISFRTIIQIALILPLEQSAFQHDHSHGENIIFVGIFVDDWFLRFYGLTLLRRKVNILQCTVIENTFKISLKTCCQRISYLDIASIHQNGFCRQTLVPYIFLLKSCQTHNRTSQNRPHLSILKGFLLQISFLNLLEERFIGVFPKSINFVIM